MLVQSTPSFGRGSLALRSLAVPRQSFRDLLLSGRFLQRDGGAVSGFVANEAQRLFCGNEAGAP